MRHRQKCPGSPPPMPPPAAPEARMLAQGHCLGPRGAPPPLGCGGGGGGGRGGGGGKAGLHCAKWPRPPASRSGFTLATLLEPPLFDRAGGALSRRHLDGDGARGHDAQDARGRDAARLAQSVGGIQRTGRVGGRRARVGTPAWSKARRLAVAHAATYRTFLSPQQPRPLAQGCPLVGPGGAPRPSQRG